MSGGHYEYLYIKEPDEFMRKTKFTGKMDMAVRDFEEAGYPEIAEELEEARDEILEKWDELEEIKEEIAPLLKAMSYWKCGDHGEENFREIIEEKRPES